MNMKNRKTQIQRPGKTSWGVCLSAALLLLFPMNVFATDVVVGQINVLKDLVLGIITAIGSIVLAWGIFEFAFSYQSHDTSQQTAALKKVVSGLIMVAAGLIVGSLSGTGA